MYFGDGVTTGCCCCCCCCCCRWWVGAWNKVLLVACCNALTCVLGPSLDSRNTRERERDDPLKEMARGCVHLLPKVQLSKCLEFKRSKFMRGLVRTIDSPDITWCRLWIWSKLTRGLRESRILACRRFGAYSRLARGVQSIFSPELDWNSFDQQIRLEVAPRWTVQKYASSPYCSLKSCGNW